MRFLCFLGLHKWVLCIRTTAHASGIGGGPAVDEVEYLEVCQRCHKEKVLDKIELQ